MNTLAFLLLATGIGLSTASCTYRAWYEGLQERERQECYKNPNPGEVNRCLEGVNSRTYDAYRRSQKDSPKPGANGGNPSDREGRQD